MEGVRLVTSGAAPGPLEQRHLRQMGLDAALPIWTADRELLYCQEGRGPFELEGLFEFIQIQVFPAQHGGGTGPFEVSKRCRHHDAHSVWGHSQFSMAFLGRVDQSPRSPPWH
jgi:hypothetical protein